jgi:KEOPS complex subunit Pcc1
MTLQFNANITIDAKEKTKSIFQSINTDNKFYPENPTKTKISFNGVISISIEAKQLSNLRANLNSTLRLIQASFDSIESVNILD